MPYRERSLRVKNRMRVIRSSGSVRGGDGNIPAYSARRFQDRACVAARVVELAIAAVGISLEDAAVAGQMGLRMLAGAIARVIKYCPRPGPPAKRLVVAHIDPDATGVGLAFGYRRIIPVQSLGTQHMGLEPPEQGRQRNCAATNLVGKGRQADRHAFLGIAFVLPVQRLVLAEL